MRKLSSPPLRSMLFNTPSGFSRLPIGVLRQLVTYYSAWRRSRDLMNVIDENGVVRQLPANDPRRSAPSIPTPRHS